MNRPNIVYILSDQHNPEVMGFAGDAYVRTPRIDRLAMSGVSLSNCYCASPLCVPSRSSLLSGLRPAHTGVYNNMQILPSDKATFVHSLGVAGYDTVLSGRMHFLGPDQRHGFQKRFVGDITPSWIGADNEYEIYGSFCRSSGQNTTSLQKSGGGWSGVLDFDREVTNEALRYLRERVEDRPLFLCVGLYGPHCPYIAPEKLFSHYYDSLPTPEEMTPEERTHIHPAIRQWYENRKVESLPEGTVRRIRAAYYGMVEYVDGLVGEVLDEVERTIGLENTLILYGSDHGDNIGKHGLFWKTNFYEGAARVPMIFSWEGVLPKGRALDGITSLLDVAPTLLELANAPALPAYDGCSLFENLKTSKPLPTDRVLVAECSDIKGDNPSAMLRTGRYKLILYAGYAQPQLFDLQSDPDETHDLAGLPGYEALTHSLRDRLLQEWDPERAITELQNAKAHADLMTRWVNTLHPEPIEEWYGDNRRNYLTVSPGNAQSDPEFASKMYEPSKSLMSDSFP